MSNTRQTANWEVYDALNWVDLYYVPTATRALWDSAKLLVSMILRVTFLRGMIDLRAH